MKASTTFIAAIATFMTSEAQSDPMFAAKMAEQPDKTPEAACNFILSEVSKSKQCGYADEEIYGMVRHFIDEKDIPATGHKNSVQRVVVNNHVELSASEKAKIKKEAEEEYRNKVMAEQERKSKPAAKPKKIDKTPDFVGSLFDGL